MIPIILVAVSFIVFVYFLLQNKTNREDENIKVSVQGKLVPDMVPLPFINVRTRLIPKEWEQVRKTVFDRTGGKCEKCGTHIGKSLHVHEQWHLSRRTATQSLIGLMGLCPDCHGVYHILNSQKRGVGDRVFNHMLQVNGWTVEQGNRAVAEATAIVRKHGKAWWLDLTYLNNKQFDFLVDEYKNRIIFTNKENNNCRANVKRRGLI
ncbi:HNH endonuclease [Burkholderia cepacia]|uniref:HNH endonuclease n=1 Tax=Burkholderia cepacia TaxID=292 RepID=UPI00158A2CD6|nr:HNH endonuclease [Burkholderia cepacia]